MKKKVSADKEARNNPVAAALDTATRALDKQQELYGQIRDLEEENETLQDKLDEISEVLECDDPECDAQEHLDEIEQIVCGDAAAGED